MADSVSVTSHHSYGSRVGNSFKNILWWLLLLVISIIILVWNENNYVKEKNALNEWSSIVQEASSTQIDSSLEWKLVHLYGETASDAEDLQDNVFWIVADDLKLQRKVEMYQWYEETSESCTDNLWWSEECTTTYTYDKQWNNESINSNNFHESDGHNNPLNWEYESTEQSKSPITLWQYTLSTTFVGMLDNYTVIDLNKQTVKNPKAQNESDSTALETADNEIENNNDSYLYWDTTTNNDLNDNLFHIQNNYIYIWEDPNAPAVGDLRISFSSVKTGTVSIVWKQVWNELSSYTTSNGRSIALLEQWNITADDMFQHAQQANKMWTWIVRFIGLLLMFCAFSMMMQFIETLAKVLPFLANIIWVWTRLIAFCLTLVVWFVVIWLAWIAVRPIVWISCLVVAAGWIFLLVKSKKNKKNTESVEWPKTNNSEPTEVIEV